MRALLDTVVQALPQVGWSPAPSEGHHKPSGDRLRGGPGTCPLLACSVLRPGSCPNGCSTDLEEVGDGILPWPQALGKSTSDWCPPSWCTWEVRGHSKASRARGELASGQRTLVVAFEPTLSRILNFCTFCPAPILPLPRSADCICTAQLGCTKQEHTRRFAHIVHSPACCLATPALCPSSSSAYSYPPSSPLTYSTHCHLCLICTLAAVCPLSSPLYCLPPSCLICAGLSSVLSLI